MLPLLVNSRLQPSQTRRTALGFFSFASLTFICRLFGPSKKIKHRIYNHLPPLWVFIKTQVPYLQSLAASFSKTWGSGRTPNQVFAINNFQTLFSPRRGYFRNSYFSWARPGTAHTASDRPRRNARKHSANTEWLSETPKYCQKGAWAPG